MGQMPGAILAIEFQCPWSFPSMLGFIGIDKVSVLFSGRSLQHFTACYLHRPNTAASSPTSESWSQVKASAVTMYIHKALLYSLLQYL